MPAYYYHTNIGDRGMRLSDGQRQRLSIVRAVFKNPAILILDEATLVLDTESERLVQDALKKLMVGRTTLVIAHRLSTIIKAYEILVMKDGRIVERGSHQDLIEMEAGIYRILTLLQKSLEYSVRGHCKGCKKDSCANRMLPNFCLNNCYLPKHVNKVNN